MLFAPSPLLGLKLWTSNAAQYGAEAVRLFRQRSFDYIELYVVPGTTDTIPVWKSLGIPLALHAPHLSHGVNLADADCFTHNKKAYGELQCFTHELDALYVVAHPETGGSIHETLRQLSLLRPERLLLENKPPYTPLGPRRICRGATFEEIEWLLQHHDCGFCLDIGHAMCTANAHGIEPYAYVERMTTLHPGVCHMSDNDASSDRDNHLHLGEGTYDLPRLASLILHVPYVLLETQKNSAECLDDAGEDFTLFRTL